MTCSVLPSYAVKITMSLVQLGTQVDHYSIDELIVRTGTASIYRGTDLWSGRHVVLKVPHPEVEGDLLFYQRFQREQEICERLDHHSVVKGFKDTERTQVYLVMNFVPGRLLRDILNESGKLPVERAVRLAAGICEALDYIHKNGVVHRDLKPENIIVDSNDRVTLIDFGIASMAGARRLTFGKLSQIMGTADYISPEQVRGKRGDRRSDVYALGVMLYEMLTGVSPFHAPNPFACMHNRLVNEPVPPREIEPSITPEIQEVVCRALEIDQVKRYADALALSHDLLNPDTVRAANRPGIANSRRRSLWRLGGIRCGVLALLRRKIGRAG